ncbi:hypothetical protein BG006_003827 [Podila minutissima]|uniref:Uncharacterized protein n=1 Tax=Podila minutissima TaxID=64525 RepID=A0A9P5SPC9_9FUNG|nr:hypothetical protein BG006_003827 [Podila minutissima]
MPSDPRQTPGVDPHELARMIAYFQDNFSFIHGVMDVAPGSLASRLQAVCQVIQADIFWNRQCMDELQLTNSNLTTERYWYWHENEKLREKISRLVVEKDKALEVSERAKAELEQHRTAERPLAIERVAEKAVGGTGARSDAPVETPQAPIPGQSVNSLDDSESSYNNKMDKNQEKNDARIKTKEDEHTLAAMKVQLSDAQQKQQGLQEQLAREQEKSKALIEQLQSTEQKSFRWAKDLETAAKKVAVLEGEKENDVVRISLELAQCRLDLAEARTTIDQRHEEEVKSEKTMEREDRDVVRIMEDLAQCKVEWAKVQAMVVERDEEVFKMGKAKEYEVRVLVKMLAEQEQTIEDMQALRKKESRKINTLEASCQALRDRLSAVIRPGSSSMQLRSRKPNQANPSKSRKS